MKKLFSIVLSTLLILFPTTALANSAQTYFRGISPTGTMITGEQSPLVVEQERLTFDLQEFPSEYYRDLEEYLAYTGKVTAEYTFYNPADYDVTAKLAFPFGQTPDYGYSYDPNTAQQVYATDGEKYDVTVNGVPIEKTVRHTLSYDRKEFELEKDLLNLREGYMEDTFWRFDLPVTKYTWEINGIDEEEFQAARLGFRWNGDGAERKLMLMEQCGGDHREDSVAVIRWVDNGDTVEVYVFGKPLEKEPEWFSENGAEDTPFEYELTFMGEERMTYESFVFRDWEEGSGILRHDWYNAVTQNLKNCEDAQGILGSFEYSGDFSGEDLLRWYEYEITVPAGGTIVNRVTAPIYPSVYKDYEPNVYEYTYLLSPAKTWAAFGRLDIAINTPYYMTTRDNRFSFEKAENGYQASFDGLPDGELIFSLSQEEAPKKKTHGSRGVGILLLLGAAGGGAFMIWRKGRKTKE